MPLAAAQPDAHRLDLAQALTSLASHLGQAGRRQDSLVAAEEAVGIYAACETVEWPDLPGLAAAFTNLSAGLGSVGRREEALGAIEQATMIRRELARVRPDLFLPELAASLNHQSVRLRELGRPQDGIAAIEEAVTIRRELAEKRPDGFLPDLAMSLDSPEEPAAIRRKETCTAQPYGRPATPPKKDDPVSQG